MLSKTQYEQLSNAGRLKVVDRGRRRTLYLGSLPQTTIDLVDPDRIVAQYIAYLHVGMVFLSTPREVLFLGLGGGAGVRSFRSSYPEIDITAVDIDPEVVEVARRYFFLEEDEQLSLVVADGRSYLNVHPDSVDMIILDVYNQDGYPSRIYTRESYKIMSRALRDGEQGDGGAGVLIMNAVGWLKGPRSRTLQIIIKTLRSVFSSVYIFEVKQSLLMRALGGGAGNNFIIVAQREGRPLSRRRLRHRAERVQRKFRCHNYVRLISSYRETPRLDEDIPLLTDEALSRGEVRLTV